MRSVQGMKWLAVVGLLFSITSCDKQEMADRAVKVWKAYFTASLDAVRANKEMDGPAEMDKAAKAQGFKDWMDFVTEAVKVLGDKDWTRVCDETTKWYQAEVEKLIKEMAEKAAGDGAAKPDEDGGAGKAEDDPDQFAREAARTVLEDCPEYDEALAGTSFFGIYEGETNVGTLKMEVSAAPDKAVAAYRVAIEMNIPAEGAKLSSEALLAANLSLVSLKRTYAVGEKTLRFEARNDAGNWTVRHQTLPPSEETESAFKGVERCLSSMESMLPLCRRLISLETATYLFDGLQIDEISQTPGWTDWDSAAVTVLVTVPEESSFDHRNEDLRGREIVAVTRLKNGEEKEKNHAVVAKDGRILRFWTGKDEQRFIAGTEAQCKADLPKIALPATTPSQHVKALMEAGKQGQLQAVQAMVLIMTRGAKGFFEEMLKEDPPSDAEKVLSFEIVSEKIEGRRAEVKVKARMKPEVEGEEKEDDEITFGFRIEDNEWRLFRMREKSEEWSDFEEIARIMKQMREKGSPDGENE